MGLPGALAGCDRHQAGVAEGRLVWFRVSRGEPGAAGVRPAGQPGPRPRAHAGRRSLPKWRAPRFPLEGGTAGGTLLA